MTQKAFMAHKLQAWVQVQPCQHGWVLRKSLLPGLQMVTLLILSPHIVERGRKRETARSGSFPLLLKTLILSWEPYLQGVFYSQRPHLWISLHWVLGLQQMNFGHMFNPQQPESKYFSALFILQSLWQLLNSAFVLQKEPQIIHKQVSIAIFQRGFM